MPISSARVMLEIRARISSSFRLPEPHGLTAVDTCALGSEKADAHNTDAAQAARATKRRTNAGPRCATLSLVTVLPPGGGEVWRHVDRLSERYNSGDCRSMVASEPDSPSGEPARLRCGPLRRRTRVIMPGR